MAVNLSPIWGAGAQLFDNSGNVLSGGKIYTYAAGTTTPATTYTSSSGITANSNPIILNSAGRVPYEIWLSDTVAYKFVLKDSNDTLIATYDNLVGINSNFIAYTAQQEIQTATAGQTVFNLATIQYQPATNNLSVFVDGVNQYGPGAQYAYVETDSDTVTFVSGLHVGASVKFTTASPVASAVTNAADVAYDPPFTGSVGTNVEAKLAQYMSVKDFGADSTGVASCSTAFSDADLSGALNLTIPAGTYLVSTDVTFTLPVTMDAGAILDIPTGVTVTFNGGFYAGVYKTFNCTGTGAVVFNQQNLTVGYPEWWGAEANLGVDSYAAIMACLTACRTTQLSGGTYGVSDTVKMINGNQTLRGVGEQYWATEGYTRLLVTSGSLNTLQVGPDSAPASIGLYPRGFVVENLYLGRTIAPVISSACVSILCKYSVGCNLNNVKATESIYSFEFVATVGLVATRCQANRSAAGTGAGTDIWYGYYINGLISVGFAGGNASIYLNYCTAGCNIVALQTANSVGFYINGAFSDTYLESPETSQCNIGITVEGNASASLVASNTDLMIKNPIIDQFGTWGIYLHNINKFGSAIINSGYYGASTTATIGLYINDCLGAVTVEGGQFVLIGALSLTAGIGIVNSNGVVLNRPQMLDCVNYAVSMSGSKNCDIRPLVKNYQNNITAAVELLANCSHNYVAPDLYGAANLAQQGVQLVGTTNTYNEINCTLINPAVLSTGSTGKLTINSVPVTTTGLSGTNLVSGVML